MEIERGTARNQLNQYEQSPRLRDSKKSNKWIISIRSLSGSYRAIHERLGTLVPDRRQELSHLLLLSLVSGNLAVLMTGSLVGLIRA